VQFIYNAAVLYELSIYLNNSLCFVTKHFNRTNTLALVQLQSIWDSVNRIRGQKRQRNIFGVRMWMSVSVCVRATMLFEPEPNTSHSVWVPEVKPLVEHRIAI
jgi:hypothetical protein